MNIIRKNLFYVAYQSVINSLIFLAVLFLIFNINLFISQKKGDLKQFDQLTGKIEQLSSHVSTIESLHGEQIDAIGREIADIKCSIDKLKIQGKKSALKKSIKWEAKW